MTEDAMPLADAEAMLRHWSEQSGYFASARAARTLLVELHRLRSELADERSRRTTGGSVAPVDPEWANQKLGTPDIASAPAGYAAAMASSKDERHWQ